MFDAANLQPFDMHARAQVMCHCVMSWQKINGMHSVENMR